MSKKQQGKPVEPLDKTAERLIRLAPGARRVVGKDWFFESRVEAGYLGNTLVCLSSSFENQEKVLDFIENATPEVVKALALKALAYEAVTDSLSSIPVEFTEKAQEAIDRVRKAGL